MKLDKNFLWGTATASVQIEGAYNEDGKSPSVWDELTPGHIAHNETCQIACDHYHRYKEDVKLMKQMGLNSYRFSISWSRIIPNKDGKINEKGIKFYSDLVDELIKNNIEPLVTLYHWDMPMWVYEDGGFMKETFVNRFLDYVKAVVDNLSDRVKYWMTFNEPQCFVGGGYLTGWNVPYLKTDQKTIETISRHVLLAHGKAAKYIRENAIKKPLIGFAPAACLIEPINNNDEEIEKAYQRTFSLTNGCYSSAWWSDPIVLGVIPNEMNFLTKEDIEIIHQPLDFYAFNIYQADNVEELHSQGMFTNALNWIVTKNFLYYAIKFFDRRYKLPILISENGYAGNDIVTDDGKIHDIQRIYYLQNAIEQVKKAISEGVNVIGYTVWTFMDNFEWSMSYDPRFGLIYVDYQNDNKRIFKDSAYYYKKVIESNGEETSFVVSVK